MKFVFFIIIQARIDIKIWKAGIIWIVYIFWIPVLNKRGKPEIFSVLFDPIGKFSMADMCTVKIWWIPVGRINYDESRGSIKQTAHVVVEYIIFYQMENNVEWNGKFSFLMLIQIRMKKFFLRIIFKFLSDRVQYGFRYINSEIISYFIQW